MRWCIKRSVLCFWELFLERCEGEEEQVPRLRQDFTQEWWEAIGRVWWKGYLNLSIIPIQLSPAFVRACYPRISSVDDELLMKSFSRFISGPKWMAVKKKVYITTWMKLLKTFWTFFSALKRSFTDLPFNNGTMFIFRSQRF